MVFMESTSNCGGDRFSPGWGQVGSFAEEVAIDVKGREDFGDWFMWTRHLEEDREAECLRVSPSKPSVEAVEDAVNFWWSSASNGETPAHGYKWGYPRFDDHIMLPSCITPLHNPRGPH